MPLTGEEIRANLTRLVARWSVRDGSERREAQTFLTELFACYGQRLSDVAEFERFQAGGFVDLIWPRVCIVEMKSASEAGRLSKHREQALSPPYRSCKPLMVAGLGECPFGPDADFVDPLHGGFSIEGLGVEQLVVAKRDGVLSQGDRSRGVERELPVGFH